MPCGQRAAVAVADVLRDHVADLRLDHQQAKAAAHILACRTGRLGGHLAVCDRCGHTHFAYHSCRDRHCPRCGSLDQALWAEAHIQHLLPASYFHLVFTVPASLRPFFASQGQGRALALDALFAAVGPNGFVHRRRYLLPLKALRPVFKAKLLEKLRLLVKERQVSVGQHCPQHLLRDASLRTWNIKVRRPLAGPQQVICYFARYTRRIAISDKRLVSYDGQNVVFRWRDRAHGNRPKTARLDAPTFCRRFLNHVLPNRFVRIRRYGLLSNRVRASLLQRCRELLGAAAPEPPAVESRTAAALRIFARDPELCPKCQEGRLVVRAEWRPTRLPLHTVIAGLMPRAP